MTDRLTAAQIAEIEARAEAATPGPWHAGSATPHRVYCQSHPIADFERDEDAAFIAAARHGIPRLAAALREAWADGKRLQDEVAALDAARREAEADLAGERGEYQRHSQGHMDRALAAEAAAAAMREALRRYGLVERQRLTEGGGVIRVGRACKICRSEWDLGAQEAHAAACALASPTPGAALLAELEDWRRLKDPAALVVNLLRGTPAALTRDQFLHLAGATDYPALLAERDRLREALEEIAAEHDAGRHDGLPEPCPALDADTMFALARAALKETSNGG